MSHSIENAIPIKSSERYVILDALRGFALFGIALANFPEFSLYTFLNTETTQAMPSFAIDRTVRFLQYMFIDGKFYTVFSLLFGIGFSIIISNAMKKGADGFRIFYRRMTLLAAFGFLHLMFIWSGDILMLYALLGLLLPSFCHLSDKRLFAWSATMLFLPVIVDFIQEIFHMTLSAPIVELQRYYCAKYGITDANFAYWLHDAKDYKSVFEFLIQGALVRVQEFIDGNRYFKVFGLFLLGFYIGKHKLYADIAGNKQILHKTFKTGLFAGLPLAVLYTWSGTCNHPLGLTVHSILYLVSVFPLGFAYVAGICLLYLKHPEWKIFSIFAAPGRMALTNYIMQSVIGMLLFYGIGFGLGSKIGLWQTELIVMGVFLFQIVFSHFWFALFKFGPLEWIWRMLTYGKWFNILK